MKNPDEFHREQSFNNGIDLGQGDVDCCFAKYVAAFELAVVVDSVVSVVDDVHDEPPQGVD